VAFELLANPLSAYYASGDARYARNIWAMLPAFGRVYFGGGNASNFSKAANAGSTIHEPGIWSYDPGSNTFTDEYPSYDDEQVGNLRLLGGTLYVPGYDSIDNTTSQIYANSGSGWSKITVPGDQNGHIFDVASFDGKLWVAQQAAGKVSFAYSTDGGSTWTDATVDANGLSSFNGDCINERVEQFHFVGGSAWGSFADAKALWMQYIGGGVFRAQDAGSMYPGHNASFDTPYIGRSVVIGSTTIYLGVVAENDMLWDPLGWNVGSHSPHQVFTCTAFGSASAFDLPNGAICWDLCLADTGSGTKAYALGAIGTSDPYTITVCSTADGATWTQEFSFSYATFARSFCYLDGYFYFGFGCEDNALSDNSGDIGRYAFSSGGGMSNFSDSFTRADDATTLGSNWVVQTTGAKFGIQSNKAYHPTQIGFDSVVETATPASADYSVQADVFYDGTGFGGLVGRATDDNNYYMCAFDGSNIEIWKRVGGSFSNLASVAHGQGSSFTATLKFTLQGTSLKVDIGGVNKINITDSAISATGKRGLFSNSTTTTWDNYAGTDIVTSSLAVTGNHGETTLPSNHKDGANDGQVTVKVVGAGTSFSGGSTGFSVSGLTGWSIISVTIVDGTNATVVLGCPTVASPPAGATGTLTLTETGTGSATGTIAVATPTLSASPSSVHISTTKSIAFTGVGTLWQDDNPQFTISGVSGTSIGAATETSDTASSASITTGSTAGSATVTDPSTGAQTTITVTTAIPYTNANIVKDPYVWHDNGSALETWNADAEIRFLFTGTSLTMELPGGQTAHIIVSIDDLAWTGVSIASGDTSKVLATGLASGTHRVRIKTDDAANAHFGIVDFVLDSGENTVAPDDVLTGGSLLLISDSRGAGSNAASDGFGGANAAERSFFDHLGEGLTCERGNISLGGQGFTAGTTVGSSWDKYDYTTTSRLSGGKLSPIPKAVVIVEGANDNSASDADVETAVQSFITAIRAAVDPTTPIIFAPLGSLKRSAQQTAVSTCGDNYVLFVDLSAMDGGLSAVPGSTSTPSRRAGDQTHPGPRGHAEVGARLVGALAPLILPRVMPAARKTGGFQ